ncbi:hypothetical protein C4552_01915 [Candidatus Parcubacteria bacterium]|nr:MAG: hypothetical protein C4552_01915 [Candidatus Parcubacteria bacterium]
MGFLVRHDRLCFLAIALSWCTAVVIAACIAGSFTPLAVHLDGLAAIALVSDGARVGALLVPLLLFALGCWILLVRTRYEEELRYRAYERELQHRTAD